MGTITRNFANNILGTGEVDATDGVNGTIPATNVADASLNNVTSLPSSVGYAIKSVASDPPSLNAGEIFYNSTSGAFKALVNVEAWASGSPLLSPQRDGGYGQSSPTTTAWIAGGTNASTRNITTTQEYNGSGWSTGGSTNTGREEITGFGLVNAGTLAGGATYPPSALKNEVEEYDGSSWTAATALPAKRKNAAGCGTQTAGLVAFGALDPPSTSGGKTATSLEYDGTSWTAGGTGNTARVHAKGSAGSQTAGLAFGGEDIPPSSFNTTEEYDGSTWTTGGALNTARSLMAGSGIQTSALAYGGFTPYSNKTEKYDGTSWTNTSDLATARDRLHGAGTNTSAAVASGGLTSPGTVDVTEEFNASTNTITAAAWASGGNMVTSKQDGAGFGTQTAAIGAGGYVSGYTNNAQSYDGSSWTSVNSINTTRSTTGLGTQTAGLIHGGNTPGDSPTGATETWDGTNWTSVNSMNTARAGIYSMGTQSDGLTAGGSPTSATETWDGTSWTAGNNINTARRSGLSAGTTSAAMIATGDPNGAPPETSQDTEEWNGTSWSSGNNTITARNGAKGFGLQDSAVITSGFNDGASVQYTSSEIYNGTSWATYPSISSGRGNTQPSGVGSPIASSGMIFGGFIPGYFTATEEFTDETVTQVAKTLSSS